MTNKTPNSKPADDIFSSLKSEYVKICKTLGAFKTPLFIFPSKEYQQKFVRNLARDCTVVNGKYVSLNEFVSSFLENEKVADWSYFRDVLIKILSLKKRAELDKTVGDYLFENGSDNIDGGKLFEFSKMLTSLFEKYDELKIWDDENVKNDKMYYPWQKKLYDEVLAELKSKNLTTTAKGLEKLKAECCKKDIGKPFSLVGFDDITKANTLKSDMIELLSKAPNYKKLSFKISKFTPSITLSAAVSKLREVENLHRQICDLLLRDEDVTFDDIVVYCPNIAEYFTPIMQVFNCYESQSGGKYDDLENSCDKVEEKFPIIPFSIHIPSFETSQIAAGLNVFKAIADKGYVDRVDALKIFENSVVRSALNLSYEEVESIKKWIGNMCIYRDRPDGREDQLSWKGSVKRLSLSLLSDREIKALHYDPYTDMSSTNKVLLSKYFKIIDILEDFCTLSKKKVISKNDIISPIWDGHYSFKDMIVNLFFLNLETDELTEENKVMMSICHELNNILDIFYNQGNIASQLSFECFFSMVLESAKDIPVSIHSKSGGVRFTAPNERSVSVSKYVFLLGMGLDNFPFDKSESSIDLSSLLKNKTQENQDNIACSNLEGRVLSDDELLTLIYDNTEREIYISYNNFNLQKESELYISPVVPRLIERLYRDGRIEDSNNSKSDLKAPSFARSWIKDNTQIVNLDTIILPKSSKGDKNPTVWSARVLRNMRLLSYKNSRH